MAKSKSNGFFCSSCGHESSKWMGQCPACKEWNTFVEAPTKTTSLNGRKSTYVNKTDRPKPKSITEISMEKEDRVETRIKELDRVLGGGIVPGSLLLLGGDPGIGKSTLLLQVCKKLADDGKQILYISGEESLKQIKLRAERIGTFTDGLRLLCETNVDVIEDTIRELKPDMVVIDSIQTIFSEEVGAAPGNVSQVKQVTARLLQISKGLEVTIFIIGHVTKEGTVAGPRVLEHMVDTVLYFEGDRHASYRILRGVKNRFGSTNEIGVFEMQNKGLVEVENASEFLLDGKPENASGSIVTCSIEGTRPILLEVQALVCGSNFGIPRRQATGTDFNRVNLLMAVLEKRVGLHLADSDAYVNIAGGIKISEPALDLGIALAIASSYKNKTISEEVIAFGEIGLSGEVRAVNMPEQRVKEAIKLGFTTCVLPKASEKAVKHIKGITFQYVKTVADAVKILF